jgi:hypothetical protein
VLVAAAFAPHPPVIVPELAAGAADQLDRLRAACDQAVRRILGASPDRVVVLGAGPAARWDESDAGTFAGYGVPLAVPLGAAAPAGAATGPGPVPGSPDGPPRRRWMPLSLTVGAWLLARAGYAGPRHAVSVPAAASDAELASLAGAVAAAAQGDAGAGDRRGAGAGGPDDAGHRVEAGGHGAADGRAGAGGRADAGGRVDIGAGGGAPGTARAGSAAENRDRVGLLVMGDGSARRSLAAPGYLDARAAEFDADIAAVLRAGDPAGLRALDPALGADLIAAGVPAWRLAGWLAAGRQFDADLLYDDAPYGVGYLVAVWLP